MSRALLKQLSVGKGTTKAIDITRFLGIDFGSLKSGTLTECENMTVLSGGALKSLLSERKLDIELRSTSLEGIYTTYIAYDHTYETQVDEEWIYKNICPSHVLDYKNNLELAARIFVKDIGRGGKVKGGYRNVLAAFCDSERIYVFYDAVYNIIDQRRTDEYARVGNGYTVTFDSKKIYSEGTGTTVYTLSQLWMDVIYGSEVTSTLVDAQLVNLGVVVNDYCMALLVSTDGDKFRYVTPDYKPSIGASYSSYYDLIYTEVYPLLTAYPVKTVYDKEGKQIVRYCNKYEGAKPYKNLGEHIMLLPDMRVLTTENEITVLMEACETMPKMTHAVQYQDRLFGFFGERLYASALGDCTNFEEDEENLSSVASWQTVTSDKGGFKAIESFGGKLIVFTEKNMMTVRGSELPFSVSYIGSYGCKRQESVAVIDGWLYFASFNGIFRYNGSRVECISEVFSPKLAFADAKVFSVDGMLAVSFIEYDGFYLFNPQSESWTHKNGNFIDIFIPKGMSGKVFEKTDGSYSIYEICKGEGEFSFALSLGSSERKRICAVSVTASFGVNSELVLTDKNKNELMKINGLYDETVTRTCIMNNVYADGGTIFFKGKGNVTVYGVRVEYKTIHNRLKNIL